MRHIAIAILSGALLIRPALAACPTTMIGCVEQRASPSLNDIGSPAWSPATKDDIDNLNKRLDVIEKLIRAMWARIGSAPPTEPSFSK
jgi:hypothetical protein